MTKKKQSTEAAVREIRRRTRSIGGPYANWLGRRKPETSQPICL